MNSSSYNVDDTGRYLDLAITVLLENKEAIQCKAEELQNEGFNSKFFEEVLWHNRVPIRVLMGLKENVPDFYPEQVDKLLGHYQSRARKMVEYIHFLQETFTSGGVRILFIKTLDNYPDFGHDVDLLILNSGKEISNFLISRGFQRIKPTVAERIAIKLNFCFKDSPAAEIHCGRLGEVGEHQRLCKLLFSEKETVVFEGRETYTPSPESKIILMTLQRIYRHFNIRACDVLNASKLFTENKVDMVKLKAISKEVHIWPGVKIFLSFCSQILTYHNQRPLVIEYKGKEDVYSARRLYRFPIWTYGFSVYLRKLISDMFHGNVSSIGRLSLIPFLSLNAYLRVILFKREGIW